MNPQHLQFLRMLCQLRWLAVLSQAVVAGAFTALLAADLPAWPLWSGIAVLAGFNLYATWRVAQPGGASAREAVCHIGVDVAVLAWLIGWSGGVANPFTSLFLLPIAFAALALPMRWIHVTAGLCGVGYAACAWFGRPLPHVHGFMGSSFDLHLWGMAVNFLISAGVVLFFFSRLAATLRRREQELADMRERFARNEGIVALATHAASVAHELNTPLATLTITLDDLLDDTPDDSARHRLPASVSADLRTMRELVDLCRDRVRELAAPAQDMRQDRIGASVDLEQVIERWQLVRPAISLQRSGTVSAAANVDVAVGHLLQALLNNAADASEAAGVKRVDLTLDADPGGVRGEIRDYGAGFSHTRPFLPGSLFDSSKPDGLGVGLVLSHATVERLGGELSMQASDGDGVCVRFRLPARSELGG